MKIEYIWRRGAPLFAVCMSALPATLCLATTFSVDSTLDASDSNAADGICNDGAGHCTLRAAIQQAEAAASGSINTVNVPAGIYLTAAPLFVTKVDAAKNLSIIGTGAAGSVIVDGSGGAAHTIFNISGGGTTALSNLTIQNGAAFVGGGIVVGQSTANISQCLITNNQATTGGNSGGIQVNNAAAVLNLDRSTVSNNSSPNDAGGIRIQAGTANISNSTIINNHANLSFGTGGGILSQGELTVINSTISGNTSSGGGISVIGNTTKTQLANVTMSANSVRQIESQSGAIIIVVSSIINNPVAGIANCFGTISSLGHNIDSGASCNFTSNGDQKNTNPMLAQLANSGGPTVTHALLPGSPALDQGDNFFSYKYDQRGAGFPRVVGAAVDVGAFEGVQLDAVFGSGFEILPPTSP